MSSNLKGICLILVTLALFTSMDSVAKHLVQNYPPIQVIWARYLSQTVVSFILLSPVLYRILRTKNFKLQILRSALLFTATVCFFTSLKTLKLADVNAIFQVSPIFVTILSVLVLKETVGHRRWLGVAFGLIGALLIIGPGTGVFSYAVILPIISALSYAAYVISTRYLSQDESPLTSFVYTALLGSIAASVLVVPSWTPIESSDLFVFSVFGLLGATGHFLLIHAYRISEASFLAPFNYIGILYGSLWGFYFFNEVPSLITILGGLIIVSSGIYIWLREQKNK
ncbi:MAG: DMT family transporter [Rhodobacteraceae bacterium]|nr:DMT family transporter [Paracoccaceae bacterium]MDG1299485.1 DMT family transporter [Paracoccaceae bacterium]|tara:strand:- start:3513 stop:4364 length:852 start_codon:yes stop_codon:yes gene_type:complete